jgi:hypothetical protein
MDATKTKTHIVYIETTFADRYSELIGHIKDSGCIYEVKFAHEREERHKQDTCKEHYQKLAYPREGIETSWAILSEEDRTSHCLALCP